MPWYREDNAAIQTSFSSTTFSLNHQKTFFEAEFKTFSWNMDNSCNNYRVTSMNCDGDEHSLWDWNIIQGTSLVIPSSYIVDSSSGQPLYFTLESLIIEGRTVTVCDSLPSNFAVKKSGEVINILMDPRLLYTILFCCGMPLFIDITERKSASYSGICIDVDSETGGLTVVLPRKTIGNDCPCTISLNNTQTSSNLTTCSCIGDTIFMDSLRVSRSEQPTNTMSYSICFYNLTREMNNTIIHFYDNNRSCTDSNGVPRIRPFRMYLKSMRIMIGKTLILYVDILHDIVYYNKSIVSIIIHAELPYQPIITVNVKTGEVFFSSDAAEGIELDHYKLTLSDVTNFVVYHRTIPHDMNSTSFGDIFQHSVCSPYNLTVSAYSVLGNSISTITMIGTGNSKLLKLMIVFIYIIIIFTDECTCIAENGNSHKHIILAISCHSSSI